MALYDVRHSMVVPILVLFVMLASVMSTSLDYTFYPPFLPSHIAGNETTFLNLRVDRNDTIANDDSIQIRIIPSSSTITFTPPEVVFTQHTLMNKTIETIINQVVSMVAKSVGIASISYYGQLEQIQSNASVVILQAPTLVATQTLDVLAPPISFDVSDSQWKGVTLLNDSFDSAFNISTLWGRIQHGYSSPSCGAADGSQALYFTAIGERSAATRVINLVGFNGKMHFSHIYGYRSREEYDATGDNRISCEFVDPGEEVVFSYLPLGEDPLNMTAWQTIGQIPLPSEPRSSSFVMYSVALPMVSMHSMAQFRWHQKRHSSFPVDPINGLTNDAIQAAANDGTSINGSLGIVERELWHYRNLFDQWALDSVRLEVRLNPPTFVVLNSLDSTPRMDAFPVSLGSARVLVNSPVSNTWVEYTVGDGTHSYPECNLANAPSRVNKHVVAEVPQCGYIHAIACLQDMSTLSIISSFPIRSSRILVQAQPPTLTTSIDTTTSIDQWTITLTCPLGPCSFIRYLTYSSVELSSMQHLESIQLQKLTPSCSYGTRLPVTPDTPGVITIQSNMRLFAVACTNDLLASEVVSTSPLIVAPRAPTFQFTRTTATVLNEFNVTIQTAEEHELGIAYVITDTRQSSVLEAAPVCGPNILSGGSINVTVRASDVIQAVTCCLSSICTTSQVAIWGPISVQAVPPVFSMQCSRVRPLTMVVDVMSVTVDAWIQYHIGGTTTTPVLNCDKSSGNVKTYTEAIEVSATSSSVFAVSCVAGLQPSAVVEIVVELDNCCSGLDAATHASCSHVLVLNDTFESFPSCFDPSKWTKVSSQWGGNAVNRGVDASNVHCGHDIARNKSVLQLVARGDLYVTPAPVGTVAEPNPLVDWALEGVAPLPCAGPDSTYCVSRRIGAAISTVPALSMNAGVMMVRLKPCTAFGTLTQLWWGDRDSAAEEREIPFVPLWKAGMYQATTTSTVSFVFSTPTLGTSDDSYIEVGMQWNASIGRANLYVNGELVLKQQEPETNLSTMIGALSLGVWFPDAIAGEPLFDTCTVSVDSVHVYKAEVSGDRWCDFENVQSDKLSCTTDQDCEQWVTTNCLMSLHEAVCIISDAQLMSTTTNHTLLTATLGNESVDDTPIDEGDVTEENAMPNTPSTSSIPRGFCQFRMEPSIKEVYASTEMTRRHVEIMWPAIEA